MTLKREIRRRARQTIAPTLGALLTAYFVLHAAQGDRGIRAWIQLRSEIARTEAQLADLAAVRARLEAKVARLRSDSLDRDLLDERARVMAGLVRPDDLVILTPVR